MRMGAGWGDDAYLARQRFFREYPRLVIDETGVWHGLSKDRVRCRSCVQISDDGPGCTYVTSDARQLLKRALFRAAHGLADLPDRAEMIGEVCDARSHPRELGGAALAR